MGRSDEVWVPLLRDSNRHWVDAVVKKRARGLGVSRTVGGEDNEDSHNDLTANGFKQP